MANLGKNTKLTIAKRHREAVRRTLTEGLGLAVKPGPSPDFDLFPLGNGGTLGVAFVADAEALDDAVQERGAWLEFEVDAVDAATARLSAAGARRVDYHDKNHPYFQLPGGPVFRLSSA